MNRLVLVPVNLRIKSKISALVEARRMFTANTNRIGSKKSVVKLLYVSLISIIVI